MTVLDEAKVKAKRHIDVLAELTRQQFISPGAGQVATYQEKAEQAIEFVAAGYPTANLANYPFIAAEVEALGGTPQQVADGILAARSAWIVAGAAIEKIRLAAKRDVMLCTTEDDVRAVVNTTTAAFTSLIQP